MDHKKPVISGLSPAEGLPGTTVTLRGENLGNDPTDILALVICGTDCLLSLKWKSSSKIIARIGNAKRGLGDIILLTKSGGKAVSNVQFRVLIEQVGPLTESAVWVDETRTVPCRSQVRNVAEVVEISDALGLNKKSATEKPKVNYNDLVKLFPDSSGNLRMGNFNSAWYLLENHKDASFSDLLKGTDNLKKEIAKEKQLSNDIHRDNLYSLINCVDSLNSLNTLIEKDAKEHNWPLTGAASKLVDTANQTADNLFSDVLSRKDRADSTRNALSVLNRFKFIFFLTKSIDENLQQGDYAAILNDYTRVKALYKDSEITLFKEVMNVLEMKMANFKEVLKHNLISSPSSFEEQSRLIKYLKILDPDSNPAWECITSYHCWLESILWENQNRYCKLANEEVNDQLEFANFESGSNYIQTFVTEILSLLTEKLPAFWKLAQNYSDASDEKYLAQQDDINQMLANTINVTSWILLNALVPSALPETVTQQYKSEFAVWPTMNQRDKSIQLNQLLLALKSLRSTVKSLLESQFSRSSVFPLTELCKTLRLKSVELLTAKSIEGILNLVNQENWNIEIDVRAPKTTIPDLFETQLNDVLPHINQILSTNGYPSEEDLFSKDSIRQIVVDRIIMMVTSIRDCYEQLLQLKFKRRPNRLFLPDTSDIASNTSSNEDNLERNRSSEAVTRRLLICVCNFDYILCHSLPLICKRLSNTVKYASLILEKSKQEFLNFRQELINKYLTIKTSPLVSLIESSSYEHLPESEDVSTFVKELIMGIIFIKAELYLLLPQLSDVILKSAIENLVQRFLQFIADVNISNNDIATQIAIDISGTEEALHSFLSKQQRDKIKGIRGTLLKFGVSEPSTRNFRESMKLAIESLNSGDRIKQDDELDSSDMGFLKKWFISFFLIEVGLHIGKFLTTEAKYALFSRLVEVTFLTFGMLLGSWFFLTKRLNCTSLNINPKARCFLKVCFVLLAIFTHIAYMFFYIDFNENSWIVYLCFMSFALYLHLVIIGFLFFLYEQLAKRVLPDKFSVFVSSTFHTLIALILAIALTAHGLSAAREKPVVNVVDIKIRGLSARFDGISIALLTDLHVGPTVSRQRVEDIVEIVNNLKVDAVAIAGDLIDGYIEHIRHKAMPLKNLKSNFGTFYTSGNHEFYHGDIHALEKFVRNDLNLTFLHNEHYLIQRGEDSICFAGVDDIKSDALKYKDYKMDPEKALSGCPKGSTVILLVHQPNAGYKILQTSKMTKQRVDLMLAGHTHNGQFYLTFPIGYFTNKYFHGSYRAPETQIFVSAGVNYWGPPVKFLCEIPIIKLHPQ